MLKSTHMVGLQLEHIHTFVSRLRSRALAVPPNLPFSPCTYPPKGDQLPDFQHHALALPVFVLCIYKIIWYVIFYGCLLYSTLCW